MEFKSYNFRNKVLERKGESELFEAVCEIMEESEEVADTLENLVNNFFEQVYDNNLELAIQYALMDMEINGENTEEEA